MTDKELIEKEIKGCFDFFWNESKKKQLPTAVFILLMILMSVCSWQGMISLLIMIALAVNTAFLALGKPQALRYSILFTSSLVLIYNVYVLSIGGILNEGIALLSALVGILRFRRTHDKSSLKEENTLDFSK